MLKRISLAALCLILVSCSFLWGGKTPRPSECPNVIINRADAYLSQIEGYKNQFKIELYGYEGYCWMNDKTNRAMASVTPLFRAIRLDSSKDEAFLSFDYMYKTSKGPVEFLGSKVSAVQAKVPANTLDYKFRGKTIDIRVPAVDDGTFEIMLMIKKSKSEKIYNEMTFDLN